MFTTLFKQLRFLSVVVIVSGCASQPLGLEGNPSSQSQPPTSVAIQERPRLEPLPVKLKLTLTSPAELKVRVGDHVQQGQFLVDRTFTRQSLEQQRQSLEQQFVLLTTDNLVLPPLVNIKAEKRRVQQAQEQVAIAEAAIKKFKQESPWTDYARERLPLADEEAQLAKLEAYRRNAKAQLDQAKALLEAAQASKLENQQTQSKRQTDAEKVTLLKQLEQIEIKLKNLAALRSPHNAIVKEVNWLNQNQTTQQFQVELTLVLKNSQPQTPPLSLPSPRLDQPLPSLPPSVQS